MDSSEVLRILESAVFVELVGATEGAEVEFKRSPYDLDTDRGRYELAKDVAAFANSRHEGVIVIGVDTEPAPDSRFDTAVRVRPVPRARVSERRHLNVLRTYCYPPPRGVSAAFHPSKEDAGSGLLAIRIPLQREDDWPFFVLRPLSENDTQKLPGWLLGLPVRTLDETEYIGESQLHELVRSGRLVSTRLDDMSVVLAELQAGLSSEEVRARDVPAFDGGERGHDVTDEPASERGSGAASLVERCRDLAARTARDDDGRGGSDATPALWIGAWPVPPTRVPTIFSRTGVRELLETPPRSRPMGWNLYTGARPEIVRGDRLSFPSSRLHVEYHRDGMLLAAARVERLLAAGRTWVVEPERPPTEDQLARSR